ncbi:hypothetical protein KIL84_005080 [Mauremys mutica]|uniref:Uncharacterized protein n=1 Tax=Mauremys mutica TaxID=74926 RepID=A0A9D3XIS2_9SAUR|nr:hypothetical protein KIL84_005080 [Mauremys mutica]
MPSTERRGCQNASRQHGAKKNQPHTERKRSWQPISKQAVAELAEVPWRTGCSKQAMREREREKQTDKLAEAGQVADGESGEEKDAARPQRDPCSSLALTGSIRLRMPFLPPREYSALTVG